MSFSDLEPWRVDDHPDYWFYRRRAARLSKRLRRHGEKNAVEWAIRKGWIDRAGVTTTSIRLKAR